MAQELPPFLNPRDLGHTSPQFFDDHQDRKPNDLPLRLIHTLTQQVGASVLMSKEIPALISQADSFQAHGAPPLTCHLCPATRAGIEDAVNLLHRLSPTSSEDPNPPPPNGCCICCGEAEEGESWVHTSCDHHFHHKCLERWLSTAPSSCCPICRVPLPNASSGQYTYRSQSLCDDLPIFLAAGMSAQLLDTIVFLLKTRHIHVRVS